MVKDTLREIKNKWFQFLAIIIITCLGVGFFIGIQVSGYDMRITLDQYSIDTTMPNMVLQSTIGIDDEMIESIITKTNSEVVGVHQGDALVISKDAISQSVLTFYDFSDTEKDVTLVQGNLPTKPQEVLLDSELMNYYEIGDTLTIEANDYLKEQTITVVGFGKSILYLNLERGSSQLGSGRVEGYGYVYDLQVEGDLYSAVRVYDTDIKTIEEIIDTNQNVWIEERFDRLIAPEIKKLEDAQKEINDGYEKIEEAKVELEKGYRDLQNGQNEIDSNRILLHNEYINGLNELDSASKKLENAQESTKNALTKTNGGIPLEGSLQEQLDSISTNLSEKSKETKKLFEQQQAQINLVEDEETKAELQNQLDAQIVIFEQQIAEGTQGILSIQEAITSIENGFNNIEQAQTNLETQIQQATKELDNAQAEIDQGYVDLVAAEDEITQSTMDLKDAQKKVDKGYREIEKASRGEIITLNRKDFSIGYQEFYDDSVRIEGIGQVFPLIFFGVAILVTLSTVTRMVDESRSQIGIYKALGYSWLQASTKFIGFTLISWLIGSLLGMLIGFIFIPDIIYDAYRLMYQTPERLGGFVWSYAWLPLLVSFLSSVGIALFKSYTTSRDNAANLMRPPVPKSGQRLFLEKITFIWTKLTFLYKVSLRNLMRNKVRMLMTIVGIGGCTGLLIVGFGLSHSINGVIDKQFGELSNYDAMVVYDGDLEIVDGISEGYSMYVERISTPITSDVSLYAVEDFVSFEEYIHLQNRITKEKLLIEDNAVVATEKLAELNNWSVGDIIILNIDNKPYEFLLTNITEHYLAHYIYIDTDLFQEVTQKSVNNNMRLFKTNSDTDQLFSDLLKQEDVLQVTDIQERMDVQQEALGSFDIVVWIITIAAFSLELIVLMNLITMNMSERYKELATLKVLGFYPKELASYLLRENIILTLISVILGCVFGYYLHQYVILSAEIDMIMFNRELLFTNYLLAAGLTMTLSILINIVMARRANNVNMSEALKTFDE